MFAVPPHTVLDNAYHRESVHPVQIARELVAARREWASRIRYDTDHRWSTLLASGDTYEAWLLSWLPGQYEPPHDHGGSTGAFTIVAGALTERVIRPGRPEIRHELVAGQSRVFGPEYVHEVRNDGVDPAISIHVYRPTRRMITRSNRV